MNNCGCHREQGCTNTLVKNVYSAFRSVIIPKTLGNSEGNYSPKVGAYKNAIVTYQADGISYIYDDKGYYALLSNTNALLTVDEELDANSTNPVQNAVITQYVTEIQRDVKTNQENIESLTVKSSENTTAITNIDARVTATETDLTELKKTVTENTTDIATLETVTGSDTLTTSAQTLTGAVNELNTDVDKNASDITDLDTRVDALEAGGGEANVIEFIKRNGVTLEVEDKTVDIAVPEKISELEQDIILSESEVETIYKEVNA